MNGDLWVSLLSVATGAAIAFAGTVVATRIRSRAEGRRELLGWAIQAALEDFKADHAAADSAADVPPLSTYTFFHFNYFQLVEGGRVSRERVQDLAERADEIAQALEGGIWRASSAQGLRRSAGAADPVETTAA